MPWEIKNIDGKFCIVAGGGTVPIPGGSHKSEGGAKRHLATLYAAEGVKGDLSLEDRMNNIRRAIWNVLEDLATPASGNAYPVGIYENYAIISWRDTYYRINFTETGSIVTLEPNTQWAEVEMSWVPVSKAAMTDTTDDGAKSVSLKDALNVPKPILHGGAIKAVGNGKVQGYLVKFTDAEHADLYGEFFTKDTFYDIQDGERVTVYYNHGQDPQLGKRVLGKGVVTKDDLGLWVEAQLELRDAYEQAVYRLVQEGKLGFSSGTLPFLVEYEQQGKSYWIKSWPIGKDASLTPCPAAGPSLTSVEAVKGLGMMQPISPEEVGDASALEILNIKSLLLTELELLEVI